MFVTLDLPHPPTSGFPGGETVLFTDTVGFISNLPYELVEAFMSTLNSVKLADLLVHVVDGSSDHAEEQIAAVRDVVLIEIDAEHVPELLVFNKADIPGSRAKDLAKIYDGVWVSATTGDNLDEVITAVGERLRSRDRVLTLQLPLDRGDLLAAAHREGDVLDTSVNDDGVLIHVVLDAVGAARFSEWRVPA